VINTELALADLDAVEKIIQKATKASKAGDKVEKARLSLFERIRDHLDVGKPVRSLEMSDSEQELLNDTNLITAKPTMFIANVAEDGFENNPYVTQVEKMAAEEGAVVVTVCASIEADIALLDEDEKSEFLEDLGLQEPGLNRVIFSGYTLLGLQTFFTIGPKEARAWTVKKGSLAPQGAGKIHTDFEKGFIRAGVVGYDDYISFNGESGAKDAGKWRLEGKDYPMLEGDVVHFRFNV